MMDRFTGQVVVVSGGADGCGAAAALRFAAEGAKVAILDVNEVKGKETAARIRATGGEVIFARTDVSLGADVHASIKSVISAWGRIDVLFNHAGTVIVKPFLDTTEADWNRMMAVNVNSMFHTSQAILPHMIKAGGGAIVNTTSISGLTASALEAAYCTSKGACIQLTRAIAVEFRDKGIRCNSVAPALIRTAHGTREAEELIALGQDWSDEDVARMQGRICEPEEVAAAVLFLASDDASFINGETLMVDNGQFSMT
ncbi:glucose 1-dehydrogenase (plasmid) [Rhodobacteraceae bacterium M382]|nr:glucose 1-dehydrogenase [Rhodobacteraceae bacterium M382]